MKTLRFAMLLSLFPALLWLTLLGNSIQAQEPHKHSGHLTKCAKVCADCQIQCDSCTAHCLMMVEAGKKEHAATLRSCLDCAECCKMAAAVTARNGVYAAICCDCCAKCCDECATACDKFPEDKHMAECAKSCRECSKACKEMISHLKA